MAGLPLPGRTLPAQLQQGARYQIRSDDRVLGSGIFRRHQVVNGYGYAIFDSITGVPPGYTIGLPVPNPAERGFVGNYQYYSVTTGGRRRRRTRRRRVSRRRRI